MKLVCVIYAFLASMSGFQCQSDTNTIKNEESTTTGTAYGPVGTQGLYGGSYYNHEASNPENIHYIHGTYQSPTLNYYKNVRYYRYEDSDESFDYYLGYGISKMTDQNFHYQDFHCYYHDINRTISQNSTIPSDHIVSCHPDSIYLCPENTETICLLNGTIYCMSKISVVVPCPYNESFGCVNSTIPCVRSCTEVFNDFENVSIPCLASVVIVDVYEDGKGKTLSSVSGTFVIINALTEIERTFCVTVIVDPRPK